MLHRKRKRFSVAFILIPVCLVVTVVYIIGVVPELLKDNPSNPDHEAQQFHSKIATANLTAVQAEDTGNYEQAFRAYMEAIQIRPTNSEAHNNYGAILMKAAEAHMDRIEPEDLTAWAALYDHNPLITMSEISKIVRSMPTERSGNFTFTVRKDVRKLIYDQVDAWNKDSRQAFVSSYPVGIDDGMPIYTVYLIYGKAVKYLLDAENRFRRAIELTPEYAVAYRNLGAVFMLLHRRSDSKMVLQQALRFNPKDRELQRYLNGL